jgi:hypothetical protein
MTSSAEHEKSIKILTFFQLIELEII